MANLKSYDFSGKKVLVRVDFNVPIKDGKITDDTRIKATLPTLNKIINDGGKIILMSHWGRPIKEMAKKPELSKKDFSLSRVVDHLSHLLGQTVRFATDCLGEDAESKIKLLQSGDVLLLENVRFYTEEEKGDKNFAQSLSKYGDVYVNDAFGTAHRAHASTAVIAEYFSSENKMFGFLMESEVKAAQQVMNQTQKPFVAIIGGAKVSDKILIIENLMNKATDIIIGGGMAYTFFKAMGGQIGHSLCEDDRLESALELLKKAKSSGVNIHLPIDSVAADKFSADAQTKLCRSNAIEEGWMGLDIGQEAIVHFSEVIRGSKTILWNGPMGVFEMDAFQSGTKAIAQAVAEATKNGAYSLIGGGDSVAAINKYKLAKEVSYVSTGGGALLEYFEGKTLPGIVAIEN